MTRPPPPDPSPRRLCVDARMLGAGGGTGVSSYTQALIAATTAAGRPPLLLRSSGTLPGPLRWLRAMTTRGLALSDSADGLAARDLFRIAQSHFNRRGRVLRLRAPGPPGIMHWSYPLPLAIAGWTNVYTIHDAIPLTHPALTPIDPARHRRLLDVVAREAARIVTVSEAARANLVRALALDPAQVIDCGEAVLVDGADAAPPAGLIHDNYLLFCGRIEPRKNLLRLIEAYRDAGLSLPLVLAGPVADGGEAVVELAGKTAACRVLDYLPRPALLAAIRDARALVFPSLAEGFGLPVAEAMALGTPALVSRDPALLEVAGDAALAVAAEDGAALAAALTRLCDDPALRDTLRQRGLERARDFTVARFAERLGRLYDGLNAVAAPPPKHG